MIDGFLLAGSGPRAGMEFVPGPLASAAPALAARVAAIAAHGRAGSFWIGLGQAEEGYLPPQLAAETFADGGPAARLNAAYLGGGSRVVECELTLPVAVKPLEQLIREAFSGEAAALNFQLA